MSTATYRWDARQAAEDYDAAGPHLHPLYTEVQDALVASLPSGVRYAVDLGGGSGRLAERLLDERPGLSVTVVDPSGPFRELAKQRLWRFGGRVTVVPGRAEEAWSEGVRAIDAVVSTSALHHLDGPAKNVAFAQIHAVLPAGGVFLNGDEYRPPSDATYRELLQAWGAHMRGVVAAGLAPASFDEMIAKWENRNLGDFGGLRRTGDDCHETVEEQAARLYGAGFADVRIAWREELWGVLVAQK